VNIGTILIAMVGIAGFAVLLQAIVLLGILIALRKTANIVESKADELRTSVIPVLEHSRQLLQTMHDLITRVEPRIDAAATDLAHISHLARTQAARFESTANDIHERVHRQTERIDGMATNVLDKVDYATRKVSDAVRGPARRISGAIAAVSAFFETLGKPASSKMPSVVPAPEHKDVPV
jgi:hypothetical protein